MNDIFDLVGAFTIAVAGICFKIYRDMKQRRGHTELARAINRLAAAIKFHGRPPRS